MSNKRGLPLTPSTDMPAEPMNLPAENSGLALNISAVEREAGLSKDVLRMWERRYGFPKPLRDDNGSAGIRSRRSPSCAQSSG